MKLDDIVVKDAKSLSTEEQAFLREHKSDLSDDQYDKYLSVVEPGEGDVESVGREGEEGAESTGEGDGGENSGFTFKSKDEFNAAVAKATADAIEKDREERRKRKEESRKSDSEDSFEKFFDEDYQAPNWNEPAKRIAELTEKRVLSALEKRQEEIKKARENLNKQFDQELEDLRASGEPVPEKGTEDRKNFERDLAKIGLEFKGVQNMNDAYKIYRVMKGKGDDDNSSSSGGNESDGSRRGISERQKSLARKMSPGGGNSNSKKELAYSRLQKSTDELLEEAGVMDEG